MKRIILLAGLFILSGCGVRHFVDVKGRDCREVNIFPIRTDWCDETKESFPPTRIELDHKIEDRRGN